MTNPCQDIKLTNLLDITEMNAHNTAMSLAMNAGLSQASPTRRMPSQNEVVWVWLRDHPHRTAKEIATATHLKETAVNQRLFELFSERGMVTRRRGSRHGKGVWEYAVAGKEYELLPRKNAKRSPEGVTKAERDAHLARVAETAPPSEPSARAAFDIEQYTLGELRAIYAELKALFD